MFSDGPPSASANSTLALKYVLDKVLVPSSKASKKVQNMIQAAVVIPSGYEVTAGIVPDVGLKWHNNEKYEKHFQAYERHSQLLFSGTLRPFQEKIPGWLTPKLLLHKDIHCTKSYGINNDHLWKFFQKVKTQIIKDYLPYYKDLVKDGQGSGKVWIEKLEALRQQLWKIEKKADPEQEIRGLFILFPDVFTFGGYLRGGYLLGVRIIVPLL